MKPLHQILRDRAARAVDQVHGEIVRFVPMLAGDQYKPVGPDPERTVQEFPAVLQFGKLDSEDFGFGRDKANTQIAARSAALHITRSAVPSGISLKKDDIIEAFERDGAPRYRIDHVDQTSAGRLVLTLTALKGA